MKRILTGITPSGYPHLGNYIGAIKPSLDLLDGKCESFLFIADLHAVIKVSDPKKLEELSNAIAMAWLASGLDPNKTNFYRQSDVPEITELAWLLSCIAEKGLLNRAHAYKAAVDQNNESGKKEMDEGISLGLFSYPLLMASDILTPNATHVPVGKDQQQHLEITRDIAEKFNNKYGNLTSEQKTLLREYINNISNTQKLKKYIHTEINSTSKSIRNLSKKVDDNIVSIKLNEVADQLQLVKKERKVKDKHMLSVLRAYDLVKEIKNVVK